jgi:1,4-alpha-glucan branching enzyme
MYAQPGKKLLFMGAEIAQRGEWQHDGSVDWEALNDPRHAGVRKWVSDLNGFYRSAPGLHELDVEPAGFEWCVITTASACRAAGCGENG